jgi:hypothetical protein
MQASIFLLKEFNNREAVTPKTDPALKTFIAAAYTRCILVQQLRNTAGQQGYVPTSHNMYNVFTDNDDTDTTATATTKIPALTTGSTITATIPELVASAINHLSTNQTALMNQMAPMLYANVPPPPNQQYQPPIQHHYSSATTFCRGCIGQVQPWKWRRWQGGAQQTGMDMGAVVLNAHRLQTLDATKVAETLAKAKVAAGFHRPQELFIHMRQLLCHLMHGLWPCLSQTQ